MEMYKAKITMQNADKVSNEAEDGAKKAKKSSQLQLVRIGSEIKESPFRNDKKGELQSLS